MTAIDLPIRLDGEPRLLDIRVLSATEIALGFLLVIFEAREQDTKETEDEPPMSKQVSEPLVPQLELELERVKRHLRDTIEQYEASNEEMKASNEELQAMNEEMRSATEEFETSRE